MLNGNIYVSIFNSDDNGHIAYKELNFIPSSFYCGNSLWKNHSMSITVTIYRYKNARMHILTKKNFSYLQCIICINITRIELLLKCELRGSSAIANKSLKVSISLFSDYFNEPCMTAAVKKTGIPSFRTPTWLMIFAFFCKLFWKRCYRTYFFLEKNKKLQTQYTLLNTWRPIFIFLVKKGFGCNFIYF